MPEELLAPPSWDDVEKDEEYVKFTPEQKAEALTNWAKYTRQYGDSAGWWQDQATQDEFKASVGSKFTEIHAADPKPGYIDKIGDFLQFTSEGIDKQIDLLPQVLPGLARGATSEGVLMTAEGGYRSAANTIGQADPIKEANEKIQSFQETKRQVDDMVAQGRMSSGDALAQKKQIDLEIAGAQGDLIRLSTEGTFENLVTTPDAQKSRQEAAAFLETAANEASGMREGVRQALPLTDEFQESFIGQASVGVGQLAQLPLYAIPGAGPAVAFTQLYQEGYDDYVNTAKQQGRQVDPQEADSAAKKYATVAGPLDVIADKLLVGKVLKALQGKTTIRMAIVEIGKQGVQAGGSEGAQQLWLNQVAKNLSKYDPDRPLTKEVGRSALMGAAIGIAGATGGVVAGNLSAPTITPDAIVEQAADAVEVAEKISKLAPETSNTLKVNAADTLAKAEADLDTLTRQEELAAEGENVFAPEPTDERFAPPATTGGVDIVPTPSDEVPGVTSTANPISQLISSDDGMIYRSNRQQAAHNALKIATDQYNATAPHTEERKAAREVRYAAQNEVDAADFEAGGLPVNSKNPLDNVLTGLPDAEIAATEAIPNGTYLTGKTAKNARGNTLVEAKAPDGEIFWIHEPSLHANQRAAFAPAPAAAPTATAPEGVVEPQLETPTEPNEQNNQETLQQEQEDGQNVPEPRELPVLQEQQTAQTPEEGTSPEGVAGGVALDLPDPSKKTGEAYQKQISENRKAAEDHVASLPDGEHVITDDQGEVIGVIKVFRSKKGSRVVEFNSENGSFIGQAKDAATALMWDKYNTSDGKTVWYQPKINTKTSPETTPSGTTTPPVVKPTEPEAERFPKRDLTKPEQMTPEEGMGYKLPRGRGADILPSMDMMTGDTPISSRASEESGTLDHAIEVATSARNKKPVSVSAVDAYGIKLPEGYVRQRELYVPIAATPDNQSKFMVPKIVQDMLGAAYKSTDDLRGKIQSVKSAGIVGNKEAIRFTISGNQYEGVLTGRNRDLVVGVNPEADKAIALRVLLDGNAKEIAGENKPSGKQGKTPTVKEVEEKISTKGVLPEWYREGITKLDSEYIVGQTYADTFVYNLVESGFTKEQATAFVEKLKADDLERATKQEEKQSNPIEVLADLSSDASQSFNEISPSDQAAIDKLEAAGLVKKSERKGRIWWKRTGDIRGWMANNPDALAPAEKATPRRIQLKGNPQSFEVIEKLPQTPIEIENNEQSYRVKNERTGEEQVITEADIAREIKPKSERVKKAIAKLPENQRKKAEAATDVDTSPDPYQGAPLSDEMPLDVDDNIDLFEELAEYGLFDEDADGNTVLEKIVNNPNEPEWMRVLAKRLLALNIPAEVYVVNRPDSTWAGLRAGNKTFFNLARNSPGVALTQLHEHAHHATLEAIRNPESLTGQQRKAYDALAKIYEQIKGMEQFQGEYGGTSLEEMVAEAFSNAGFRAKMQLLGENQSLWKKFVRAVAEILFGKSVSPGSLLEQVVENAFTLAGAPIVENGTTSQRFANATVTGPGVAALPAHHGTPYKIDPREGFRLDRIGTGEGAQAYGYGLYFAQAKKVAEGYRDKLSELSKKSIEEAKSIMSQLQNRIDNGLEWNGPYNETEAPQFDMGSIDNPNEFKEYLSEVSETLPDDLKLKVNNLLKESFVEGNLYTVDLDVSEDDTLDWDAPLSEQSDAVKQILDGSGIRIFNPDKGFVAPTESGQLVSEAYNELAIRYGNAKDASASLLRAGIVGIRYLDGVSRGNTWSVVFPSGETLEYSERKNASKIVAETPGTTLRNNGTYNYVIFDESRIKILDENGKPVGNLSEPSVAAMAPRSSITPEQDAKYLELAKNPEKNRTVLQRMADAAAEQRPNKIPGVALHYTTREFAAFDNAAAQRKTLDEWKVRNDEIRTALASGAVTKGLPVPEPITLDPGWTTSFGQDYVFPDNAHFFFLNSAPAETLSNTRGRRLIKAHLYADRMLDLTKPMSGEEFAPIAVWMQKKFNIQPKPGDSGYKVSGRSIGGLLRAKKDGVTPQQLFDFINGESWSTRKNVWRDLMDAIGYDAIKFEGNSSGTSLLEPMRGQGDEKTYTVVAVIKSEQIKSSDPVTYIDGKPVPLSERFNPESNLIAAMPPRERISALSEAGSWPSVLFNKNASLEAEARALEQATQEAESEKEITEEIVPLTDAQRGYIEGLKNPISMAKFWARKFSNIIGTTYDDRVSEGIAGLVKAAQTFNPEKGTFEQHANNSIKQALLGFKRRTETKGRDYSKTLSANAPIGEEDGGEFLETMTRGEDMTVMENEQVQLRQKAGEALVGAMSRLSDRDRSILRDYASGMNLRDVGAKNNVTQEGARKIIQRTRETVMRALQTRGINSIDEVLTEPVSRTREAKPSRKKGTEDEEIAKQNLARDLVLGKDESDTEGDIDTEEDIEAESEEFVAPMAPRPPERKAKDVTVLEVASSTSVAALTKSPEFNAAKYFGNIQSARDIVNRFVKKSAIDQVISQIDASKPAVIVPVISREGDSLNMLPLAMAEKISFDTGIPIWIQLAKVSSLHNTGASAKDRARTIHKWQGEVPPDGVQIILVDDTYTSGQTLQSLAVAVGEPVAIATIASGRYGKKYKLPTELEKKLLYKAGLSRQQFTDLYGNQPQQILTGAQAQQYLLNGAKGKEGLIARFPVDRSKRSNQGVKVFERLPTSVTAFSGGGLVELGLQGIVTSEGAVEYNPAIAQAYRAAIGDHVVVGDVRTTSMVQHRGKNHYHASPVCKNSSLLKSAVRGGVETDQDIESAESVARHIDEVDPKLVSIENVPEYRKTRAAEIIREKLRKNGYIFDEGIYNAAEYGAPTSRNRYILRAVKAGGILPTPIKTPGPSWYETVKDLIEQLPDDDISRAKYIYRSLREQGIDPDNVTEPMLVSGTTLFKKVAVARAGQPAFTFKATPATVDRILLPGGRVKRVTARAKARMTGIPDSYPLPADEKVALSIIGNGVPPALVRNVIGPLIEANKPSDSVAPMAPRSRITPEQDAEYMAAIRSGDTAKVQAMVDEAIIYDNTQRKNIVSGVPRGILEPQLRELFHRFIKAERKRETIYDQSGRAQRINTAQQDAAITRAYRNLKNKFREIFPEDDLGIGLADRHRDFNELSKAVEYDERGNVVPLSKRANTESDNVAAMAPRSKITPEQDAKYLELAKNPEKNRTVLQRMVDAAAKAAGYIIKAYHGTSRGDRVGNKFNPNRATSGPMAFFTDLRNIAENYAKGKRDTSLEMPEDYRDWFKVKRPGVKGETNLTGAWAYLSPEQKAGITAKLYTTGYENPGEGSGPIVENSRSIMDKGGIDYELRRAKGNALEAAKEIWLNSGSLFGREVEFLEVLNGLGLAGARLDDPNAKNPKVYDVLLRIKNPFVTSDITPEQVAELNLASLRARKPVAKYGADSWDKSTISPADWMAALREDIASGRTHAWTRIPDWVTRSLRGMGFDGISDTGGKMGGVGHNVWIPFDSNQIKSADPVTYIDGKPVPLSERFNPESNLIAAMPPRELTDTKVSDNASIAPLSEQGRATRTPIFTMKEGAYRAKGLFSAAGKWNDAIYKLLKAKDQFTKAALFRAQFVSNALDQSLKNTYTKNGIAIPIEQLNTALGNTDNRLTQDQAKEANRISDPEEKKAFIREAKMENLEEFKLRQEAALDGLPDNIREQILEMRQLVDNLSRQLIKEGDLSDDLKAAIDDNAGTYLHRSYRIFDGNEWVDFINSKDPEAERIRNRATSLFTDYILAGKAREYAAQQKAAGTPVSRKEALAEVQGLDVSAEAGTMLQDYLAIADGSVVDTIRGRLPGQKNQSIIKMRGDIPLEIRELWGQIDDASLNFAKTYASMAAFLENNKFLNGVLKDGLANGYLWKEGVSKTARPAGWDEIVGSEGSKGLSPLAGSYGPPILRDAFIQANSPIVKDWLGTITMWAMAAKTVYSVGSIVRNFLGNPFFMLGNGNLFMGNLGNSASMTIANFRKLGTKEQREKIAEYIELGVLGDNLGPSVLKELARRSMKFSDQNGPLKEILKKGKSALKVVSSPFEKAYSGVDDFWKIYAYESELAKLNWANPDANLADLKQEAAGIVRQTIPTYSESPVIVRDLLKDKFGKFIAPFITFTTEVIRITGGTAKQTVKELQSDNPRIRAIGAARLAGMIAVATLPSILSKVSKGLFGYDDDDEEALRRGLPKWQQNATLIFLPRDAKGNIRYIDFSFLNPYNYFSDLITAVSRAVAKGDSPDSVAIEVGKAATIQLLEPFLSEQIALGAYMDIARNQKSNGSELVNPQDTWDTKAIKWGTRIGQSFFPGTIDSGVRVYKAATGYVEPTGRAYDLSNEIMAPLLGQRISSYNPTQGLQFQTSRFNADKSDASRIFNKKATSQGTVAVGEISKSYQQANDATKRAYQEMRNDYTGAIALGLTPRQAKDVLREKKAGNDAVSEVVKGKYKKYRPSDGILDSMRKQFPERYREYKAIYDKTPDEEPLK